jgi:hypothetical protein
MSGGEEQDDHSRGESDDGLSIWLSLLKAH